MANQVRQSIGDFVVEMKRLVLKRPCIRLELMLGKKSARSILTMVLFLTCCFAFDAMLLPSRKPCTASGGS